VILIKQLLFFASVLAFFSCNKPQQFNDIQLSTKSNSHYRKNNINVTKISKRDYQNKLHGFWLAQSIANWTGLITEMDKVGTPQTMPFIPMKIGVNLI